MKRGTTIYLYELAWILPSIALPVGMLAALAVTAFGAGIHLPRPSYGPAVTAIGVLGVIGSILFTHAVPHWYAITLTGTAILFYGVYRWAFEPAF